jgi:hypothetical protein
VSEDLELDGAAGVESDAVGRSDPMGHESVGAAPEDRASHVEVLLSAKRKWRRLPMGDLACPACGVRVYDDHRSIAQHIEHHKRFERVMAVAGVESGPHVLTLDYARMHERAVNNAAVMVGICLAVILVMAVVIVALLL